MPSERYIKDANALRKGMGFKEEPEQSQTPTWGGESAESAEAGQKRYDAYMRSREKPQRGAAASEGLLTQSKPSPSPSNGELGEALNRRRSKPERGAPPMR